MKRGIERSLLLLLGTLCFLYAVFPGRVLHTAEASDTKTYLYRLPLADDDARLDSNWATKWEHGALTFKNGYSSASTSTSAPIIVTGSYSGNIAYCIEPGGPLAEGGTLSNSSTTAVGFWNNAAARNDLLTAREMQDWVGRILLYGYSGPIQHTRNNGTVTGNGWYAYVSPGVKSTYDWPKMAKAYATQYLIWETVVGERDASFNYVAPPSGVKSILSQVNANHPLRADILSYYNSIVTSVKQHLTVPSFSARYIGNAPTHTLTWDGNQYSITLTDANGVLSSYPFASSEGVTVSCSGNTMTISCTEPITSAVTFQTERQGLNTKSTVVWASSTYQDVVTIGSNIRDPVPAYFKLQTETLGSLSLTKTSEDDQVSGVEFTVTGPDGYSGTQTTDDTGHWTLTMLKPGSYTVTESVPTGYEPQEAQTVTVPSGGTASVTFGNTLSRAALEIRKIDEETGMPIAGVGYTLYRDNIAIIEDYTDQDGILRIEGLLLGDYTYRETAAAHGYWGDDTVYPVTLSQRNTTVIQTRENTRRTGTVKIYKQTPDELPMQGVTLLLQQSVGGGAWTNVGQQTTGADGVVCWTELPARATICYRVIEISTAAGYSLMSQPLWTGRLPLEIDVQEAPPEAELYCGRAYLYELTLTAVNTRITELPFTGSDQTLSIFYVATLALCAGLYFAKKTFERKKHQ